jgi:septal ring factor EnvC (AmiA/AmiB activator)
MKDSKALHHLREIVETYGKQAGELKKLRQRVGTLTRQRDQGNARNAELRDHIAKYQKALAEARVQKTEAPSAWAGGSRVHHMGD